ncbi:MAG: RDD family protein [Isosphaeraceae bacterium]
MSQPSAAGSPDTPIDATVRLMTPERLVFEYPLGGPFRRFTAYMVDLCLLALLVVGAVAVSLLLSLGAASGMGPALVAYFLLSWGYGAFCEGVFKGQTPGKRALERPVDACFAATRGETRV